MNCILPGLYLSGISSVNPVRLKDKGITHILSIFSGEIKSVEDSSFHRLHIEADDDEDQDLLPHFANAIAFIHGARFSGGQCLVHCIGGISRSSTMVIAYVMTLTGWKWREAFASVKGHHQRANPNLNFQKQLLMFEKKKDKDKGSRKDFKETILKGYSPSEEEMDFLMNGRAKFTAFVNSP